MSEESENYNYVDLGRWDKFEILHSVGGSSLIRFKKNPFLIESWEEFPEVADYVTLDGLRLLDISDNEGQFYGAVNDRSQLHMIFYHSRDKNMIEVIDCELPDHTDSQDNLTYACLGVLIAETGAYLEDEDFLRFGLFRDTSGKVHSIFNLSAGVEIEGSWVISEELYKPEILQNLKLLEGSFSPRDDIQIKKIRNISAPDEMNLSFLKALEEIEGICTEGEVHFGGKGSSVKLIVGVEAIGMLLISKNPQLYWLENITNPLDTTISNLPVLQTVRGIRAANITIESNPALKTIWGLESQENIVIHDCKLLCEVKDLTCEGELTIDSCPELITLEGELTIAKELHITNCPKLAYVPDHLHSKVTADRTIPSKSQWLAMQEGAAKVKG